MITETKRKVHEQPNWNAIINSTKALTSQRGDTFIMLQKKGWSVRKHSLNKIEKVSKKIRTNLDWHTPENERRPVLNIFTQNESTIPAKLAEKWWLIGS